MTADEKRAWASFIVREWRHYERKTLARSCRAQRHLVLETSGGDTKDCRLPLSGEPIGTRYEDGEGPE